MQTQHGDLADVVGAGLIPIVHDQDIAIGEARLSLDAGLTEHLAATLVVPLRVVSTSIVYRDGTGMPVELVEPNIHHRNETLTGVGDPMLLGAYSYALGHTQLSVRAGLSIPLGGTEEDPFVLGDMGLRHEHIQMGTGTFNPVVGLDVSRVIGAWQLGGFAITQQIVYENSKGYHAGDRYATGLWVRRALGNAWSVRAGPEFQAETAERWHGIQHTNEGNQGRLDVLLAGGVAWNVQPALTVELGLKVPIYTHVVGGQVEVPAILEAGVSWTFGGSGHAGHHHDDDDEHAHEHERHVDTTGADVADVGHAGERVDLVPVPGKLTIFDFWAQWCEPCKNLEPVLVDLARTHPDRVALRRVEVIDWDSPVAEQHLTHGGFGLPHLKVYDAKGSLVLEQSSAPGKLAALIDAVRALVEPARAAAAPSADALVVEIAVTEHGFEPHEIKVPSKRPVILRFRRTTAKTCATEVVFDHDGRHELKDLPLDQTVDLPVTFGQPGTIEYGCAMNMIHGTITVQ